MSDKNKVPPRRWNYKGDKTDSAEFHQLTVENNGVVKTVYIPIKDVSPQYFGRRDDSTTSSDGTLQPLGRVPTVIAPIDNPQRKSKVCSKNVTKTQQTDTQTSQQSNKNSQASNQQAKQSTQPASVQQGKSQQSQGQWQQQHQQQQIRLVGPFPPHSQPLFQPPQQQHQQQVQMPVQQLQLRLGNTTTSTSNPEAQKFLQFHLANPGQQQPAQFGINMVNSQQPQFSVLPNLPTTGPQHSIQLSAVPNLTNTSQHQPLQFNVVPNLTTSTAQQQPLQFNAVSNLTTATSQPQPMQMNAVMNLPNNLHQQLQLNVVSDMTNSTPQQNRPIQLNAIPNLTSPTQQQQHQALPFNLIPSASIGTHQMKAATTSAGPNHGTPLIIPNSQLNATIPSAPFFPPGTIHLGPLTLNTQSVTTGVTTAVATSTPTTSVPSVQKPTILTKSGRVRPKKPKSQNLFDKWTDKPQVQTSGSKANASPDKIVGGSANQQNAQQQIQKQQQPFSFLQQLGYSQQQQQVQPQQQCIVFNGSQIVNVINSPVQGGVNVTGQAMPIIQSPVQSGPRSMPASTPSDNPQKDDIPQTAHANDQPDKTSTPTLEQSCPPKQVLLPGRFIPIAPFDKAASEDYQVSVDKQDKQQMDTSQVKPGGRGSRGGRGRRGRSEGRGRGRGRGLGRGRGRGQGHGRGRKRGSAKKSMGSSTDYAYSFHQGIEKGGETERRSTRKAISGVVYDEYSDSEEEEYQVEDNQDAYNASTDFEDASPSRNTSVNVLVNAADVEQSNQEKAYESDTLDEGNTDNEMIPEKPEPSVSNSTTDRLRKDTDSGEETECYNSDIEAETQGKMDKECSEKNQAVNQPTIPRIEKTSSSSSRKRIQSPGHVSDRNIQKLLKKLSPVDTVDTWQNAEIKTFTRYCEKSWETCVFEEPVHTDMFVRVRNRKRKALIQDFNDIKACYPEVKSCSVDLTRMEIKK